MKWTNCLSAQEVPPEAFPATSTWAQQTDDVNKPAPPKHKLVCCAAIPGNGKFKTSDESRPINGTRRMHGAWRRAGGEDYHTCPNVQPWKKTPSPIRAIRRDTTRSKCCVISADTLAWFGWKSAMQPTAVKQHTVIFYTQRNHSTPDSVLSTTLYLVHSYIPHPFFSFVTFHSNNDADLGPSQLSFYAANNVQRVRKTSIH